MLLFVDEIKATDLLHVMLWIGHWAGTFLFLKLFVLYPLTYKMWLFVDTHRYTQRNDSFPFACDCACTHTYTQHYSKMWSMQNRQFHIFVVIGKHSLESRVVFLIYIKVLLASEVIISLLILMLLKIFEDLASKPCLKVGPKWFTRATGCWH